MGGEGSLSGKELTSSQPPRPDFERVINLDGFAACLHLQEIHMPACYVALWGGGGGGRACNRRCRCTTTGDGESERGVGTGRGVEAEVDDSMARVTILRLEG